jgi:hypothetical protein
MKSKDRELFGVIVSQETKDGFLSLTELVAAYEKARAIHGWSEINISSVMQSSKNSDRIYYILKDNGLVNIEISSFTEQCKNEGVTKVLKNLGVWKTTGRGENRMTMCHPYIWVSIALELNPMIYSKVITFITDSLIVERIDACNGYRPMMEAIGTVVECPDYKKYAVAINKKVFGKHEFGMRNAATTEELRKVSDIEKFLTRLIEQGIIDDDKSIMRVINTYKI